MSKNKIDSSFRIRLGDHLLSTNTISHLREAELMREGCKIEQNRSIKESKEETSL
jgi:hypothetical protein